MPKREKPKGLPPSEKPNSLPAEEKARELSPLELLARLPNEGRCPFCGKILWQGKPPTLGEFPLRCERGCDSKVPLEAYA